MAYCKICGDEGNGLAGPFRFWDCDDGWIIGRLCHYCKDEAKRKPKPEDYAWDKRGDYVSDTDGAIDAIYG